MDITSVLGVVIGMVLIIVVGIGPSKLGNFVDVPSIAIVLGGTIAAGIASYPFSMLLTLPKHTKMLFQGTNTGGDGPACQAERSAGIGRESERD